jgi:glucosamine-6-phosphate deaminase
MRLAVVGTEFEIAAVAAGVVSSVVIDNRRAVVGFATGSSPLGLYSSLSESVRRGDLDFSGITGFALDEYLGLPASAPQSYASFLNREVVGPLGLDPLSMHVPDGMTHDAEGMCADYERAIVAAGGVDIQIIGIGANGHLGFNEPGSPFSSRTRVAVLSETTRRDNSRFFESLDQVPGECITQGLATIAAARSLILVASGEHKSEAIARALYGPVTVDCPASILQLHESVTVVIDGAAAMHLPTAAFFA